MEEDGDENGHVDLERALDGTWDALLGNVKLWLLQRSGRAI